MYFLNIKEINMNNSSFPNYTTPSIHNPELISFAKSINSGDLITTPHSIDLLPIGNCYWNVEWLVQNQGGGVVYGWIFSEWKGLMLEAMHHAVWISPNNQLIDITQNYPSMSETHSIFLPDPSSSLLTLDVQPNILNKVKLLSNSQELIDFNNLQDKKIEILRELNQIFYDLGHRCEAQRSKITGKPFDFSPNMSKATNDQLDKIKKLTTEINQIELVCGQYIPRLNKLSHDSDH